MLKTFNEKIIKELQKYYIDENNIIKSKSLWYSSVCKLFPEFKIIFEKNYKKEEFKEIIYCLLRNISEIPQCKNQNCNNKVHLRNYIIGFQQCCCKQCVGQYQSNNQSFKDKISLTKKLNSSFKVPFLDEEKIVYEKDGNYVILKNYSIFGDEKIYYTTLLKIHKIGTYSYSYRVNEELYNTYMPSNTEIENTLNTFADFFDKYKHNISYHFFILYFPKILKIIDTYYITYTGCHDVKHIRISERIFFFHNKLKSKPICLYSNCNNYCNFFKKGYGFPLYCNQHVNVIHATSIGENEIKQFLNEIGIQYVENIRNIIQEELDIYCPKFNIAIEYNGSYYHSNIFKNNNYHFDKFKKCLDKNIYLIQIWEDDWIYNKDKTKNFIYNVFFKKDEYIETENNSITINCNTDNILFYLNNDYYVEKYIPHYTYLFKNGKRTTIDFLNNDVKCYDAGYAILKRKEELT